VGSVVGGPMNAHKPYGPCCERHESTKMPGSHVQTQGYCGARRQGDRKTAATHIAFISIGPTWHESRHFQAIPVWAESLNEAKEQIRRRAKEAGDTIIAFNGAQHDIGVLVK
jgi:hypothetical protein